MDRDTKWWIQKILDDIPPDTYGSIEFFLQQGEVTRVEDKRSYLKPKKEKPHGN